MTFIAYIPLIVGAFTSMPNASILTSIFVTVAGITTMVFICIPFTKYTSFVAILGCSLSVLVGLALPNVFFEPGYLKTASGLGEQINLVIKDFFNLNIFTNLNTSELITLIVIIILIPIIYYGVYKLKELLIKRMENR